MTQTAQNLATRLSDLKASGRHRAAPCAGLGAIALAMTAEDPDRIVVTDSQRSLTRWEMVNLALRLGNALQNRGVTPGAAIAFQLPNWWEACVINLTAALFGYRLVPLLPIYRAAELGVILPACDVEAIFVPPASDKVDYRAMVAGLAHPPEHIVTVRGALNELSFDDLLSAAPATPDLPPSDDAKMIIFTSGSTGSPKGVIHTHATIDAVVRRSAEVWGTCEDDVLYVPSPIGHIGGSIYAFEFPWLTGCRTILEDHWNPDRAVNRMNCEHVTFMAGATPFLRGLLDAAKVVHTQLPTLRRFISGGASVPPSLIHDALDAFPNAVISRAYGSTEVPLAFPGMRTRSEARAHADTDGTKAVELRLVTPTCTTAAPDEEGEIAVRGPQMLIGYLDSDHEDGCFTADGFFMMGDVGRLVDDRFIVITGRTKDIIIRKGENISPLEIENTLVQHPAVSAIAIVGAPDPERGEIVVAFVVPAEGQTFDFAQMTAHLETAGFARQKFPERLEILTSLPMNTVGKVQKPALRTLAAQKVGVS